MGGSVFINVQTFDPADGNLNYAVVSLPVSINYSLLPIPLPTTPPITAPSIPSGPYPYNPENVVIAPVVTTTASMDTTTTALLCGSTAPPSTDPSDLTPEAFTATRFESLELHTTRREIIQAMSNPFGYAARYSTTNFRVNYYVATALNGADGYQVYIRLSYFKLKES